TENVGLINKYQEDVLDDVMRLSKWVVEVDSSSIHGVVHERLLAVYICAWRGGDAERQLWEMKLLGKEAKGDIYGILLAICASQKEVSSIARLLT
ncbi:Hypothetical predicted protein, partial [Olea europaea subsp. europaea]